MKKGVFVIIIAVLITVALCFIITDFKGRITGEVVETYLKDVELENCLETGKWDLENGNFKLTTCPDERPIMRGVGIAVNNDKQSGGRAYCCNADDVEIYDCIEAEKWEQDTQDFKMTNCPDSHPVMRGVGIKVKYGEQAGGKAYCCKSNVELYNCALTSYWRKSNQDYKLTLCPEDRPIVVGVGFSVKENYQYGGKAYCCQGRLRVEEKEEAAEKEEVTEEQVEELVEEIEEEVPEKDEGVGRLFVKIFCKIFTKTEEGYKGCIGS